MQTSFLKFYKYVGILLLLLTLHTNAVSADVSKAPTIRLEGNVPKRAIADAVLTKKLESNRQIPVTFMLPLRNEHELEMLIHRIYDPQDPEYFGKYLTPEEFTERFAPSVEDYKKIISYAKLLGLTVSREHPNRTLLNVRGTVKSLETAFNVNLYQFKRADGSTFYAPDNNPEVPLSIASIIKGVVGLDTSAVRKPLYRRHEKSELNSNALYPSGPFGGFSPQDLAIAYNLSSVTEDGSGQAIALFELAGYQASDIEAYTNHFGLPAAQLQNILVDGGSDSGIDAEVTLDIELALALAPASQILVYEGPNTDQGVLDTYNRIATDNIAKQVSTSWGLGEDLSSTQFLQAEKAIFMQMAAQGQSMYAAAGDSGAYDDYPDTYRLKLVVDDPASQPYVTGVGGTTLIVDPNNGAYLSESVWDDGLGNGAGGGGVSKVWSIPSWQSNVSTVFSKTYRNVPDISLNADTNTGYAIYYDGQWQIYGGTSCASPLWAAFNALVNQNLANSQKPALGFANPSLYAIGTSDLRTTCYHDITVGNNLYYPSKIGYDNATGWGTFNGFNLFAALTSPDSINPPPENPPQLTPALNVTMSHSGTFRKGKTGTYHINVSNLGDDPTSGTVTVAVDLPGSLSYRSQRSSGWKFNRQTLSFTRSTILQPNQSYPGITLNVKVDKHAPPTVTPSVTVSGGGSVSSVDTDPTTIR